MSEQLGLLPPPPPRLTEYQAQALDWIRSTPGGLTSDQLGELIHDRRGCLCSRKECVQRGYTARDGRQMGGALRSRGLVVHRARTHWQAVDGQAMPAPEGLGGLPEDF